MEITSLSRKKIKMRLNGAGTEKQESQRETRILFSPQKITESNIEAACRAYSQIGPQDFSTVVVVESCPGETEKKLVMPSFKTVETHLGEIAANDPLRNDFADEDDDFFINDNAFDNQASLYHQLVMLQCVLDDFTVSHIQITDENSIIVKELALALEEILASKNALLVCCCNLETADKSEIESVVDMLNSGYRSELKNYLNSNESNIRGIGSFITGLLVTEGWGLKIKFEYMDDSNSIQAGRAVMQNQPIFG